MSELMDIRLGASWKDSILSNHLHANPFLGFKERNSSIRIMIWWAWLRRFSHTWWSMLLYEILLLCLRYVATSHFFLKLVNIILLIQSRKEKKIFFKVYWEKVDYILFKLKKEFSSHRFSQRLHFLEFTFLTIYCE